MSIPTSLKPFVLGSLIATLVSTGAWILAPIEARYLQTLTDNDFLIGVTFAVGTMVFSILALFIGRLSDTVGRERIILIGLALGILYPLLYASVINVFAYMGIRFIWAFSAVALGPILGAYVQGLLQGNRRRGHYLSLMYASMSLSGALGHFLGGYLAQSHGLITPYVVLSGIFLITLVIAFFVLRPNNSLSDSDDAISENVTELSNQRSLFFGIKYIFTRAPLIYYFILNASFAMNYGTKVLLWPLIVLTFTDSATVMGTIFALTGIMAAITLSFSGILVDRFGPYLGNDGAFFILIFSGLCMAFAHNEIIFAFGAILFAVGEAFYGSAQGVLLIDHVENRYRGEILGVDRIFDNSFTALALLASGALLVYTSAQTVWFLFVVLLVFSYILAKWYERKNLHI